MARAACQADVLQAAVHFHVMRPGAGKSANAGSEIQLALTVLVQNVGQHKTIEDCESALERLFGTSVSSPKAPGTNRIQSLLFHHAEKPQLAYTATESEDLSCRGKVSQSTRLKVTHTSLSFRHQVKSPLTA